MYYNLLTFVTQRKKRLMKKDDWRMDIGESKRISKASIDILRVPGGWILTKYRLDCNIMTSTFIPFDEEINEG